MSNIKELSPKENCRLLFVEVPEGAEDFEVVDTPDFGLYLDFSFPDGAAGNRKLTPGDYEILGIATELSEEVVRGLVDTGIVAENGSVKRMGFIDYEEEETHFDNGIPSWNSFLRAHNISERSLVLRANK